MIRVVRMLPPEYRTESVLTNLDVRPILAEVGMDAQEALRQNTGMWVNDVYVPADERAVARDVLDMENNNVRDQAEAASRLMMAQGEITTEAERVSWVESRVGAYATSEELGATPALDIAAMDTEGDVVERTLAQEQLQDITGYEDFMQNVPTFMADSQLPEWYIDQDTLTWMYGMNQVDWNSLLATEAYKDDLRAQGQEGVDPDFMVDTGGLVRGQSETRKMELPSGQYQDVTTFSNKVRLLDVYNSLRSPSRTEAEIRNLQDKLVAGGFLDEDDIRWWGQGYDPATTNAWRALVETSMAQQKSMQEILGNATRAKREEDENEAKKYQRDLQLSSSVGVATTADLLGQQVLGRKLSGDQHAQLVEFIHGLERENHELLDPEGGQEAEAVDVAAEVQAWIERENGAEAGAYDMLEQVSNFTDFARRRG